MKKSPRADNKGKNTLTTSNNPPNNSKPTKADLESTRIRKEQASQFENYINETGLALSFQVIFSELITKQINPENYFSYVSIRLREIGRELDEMKGQHQEPDIGSNS